MSTKISKQTRREILEALREHYKIASKVEKTKILDEFLDFTDGHRKYAIYLLSGSDLLASEVPKPGRKIDSKVVREAKRA